MFIVYKGIGTNSRLFLYVLSKIMLKFFYYSINLTFYGGKFYVAFIVWGFYFYFYAIVLKLYLLINLLFYKSEVFLFESMLFEEIYDPALLLNAIYFIFLFNVIGFYVFYILLFLEEIYELFHLF